MAGIHVALEHRRTGGLAEAGRRDNLLAVDLHDVVEVVIAGSPGDDVRNLALAFDTSKALVVVDVAAEDDVGNALGARTASVRARCMA